MTIKIKTEGGERIAPSAILLIGNPQLRG